MANTNGYTGQIKGPFTRGLDIYALMKEQMVFKNAIQVFKLGIISYPGHIVRINNQDFEIGTTGIFEVRDTIITSLSFNQDEDARTFVDYAYTGE